MKICFVTSSFPRYKGDYAGLNVFEKALALSREHEIHVIYPTNPEPGEHEHEPFLRHPLRYPFKTYPLAQVRGWDLLNVYRLLLDMIRAVKRVKSRYHIDLFYAFWTIPGAFVCSLACGDTPYMVELLGSDAKVFGRGGIARPFIRHSLRRASRIVALSQELKLEAIEIGAREENVFVIPPGIDVSRFSPMDKGALRERLGLPPGLLLLYVGSLFRLKRVDRIIKAGANLSRDFDFHTVIIGDGPERQKLEGMAEYLGVKNVRFMGTVSHDMVPFYMAASDILALTSETEGLPYCVQEAMASCLPVVTSSVGGLPDIVADGVNGYLVNSDEELERSLSRLMSSPALRAELGSNARAFACRYLSGDVVFEQVNELCKSTAGNLEA